MRNNLVFDSILEEKGEKDQSWYEKKSGTSC